MKRKIVSVLCVAALASTMMVGCGNSAGKETTAATEATEAAEATEEVTEAPTEVPETEAASEEQSETMSDQEAADKVAAMIDAIYVQERTDDTDTQCAEAKAAWDALTDAQKELVEGEEADPDYFGRDTGDASKDDPLNADEIGENELLVVSFGTSFNDSRDRISEESKKLFRKQIPSGR